MMRRSKIVRRRKRPEETQPAKKKKNKKKKNKKKKKNDFERRWLSCVEVSNIENLENVPYEKGKKNLFPKLSLK